MIMTLKVSGHHKASHFVRRLVEALDAYATSLFIDIPEFRPFHSGERGSVAMFVAGASRAQFLPVSEFPVSRRNWDVAHLKDAKPFDTLDEQELRPNCYADFWVSDPKRNESVLIEFKQANAHTALDKIESHLETMMKHARSEVSAADEREADFVLCGLIAPLSDTRTPPAYEKFAQHCEWAYLLSQQRGDDNYAVYLYFDSRRHGFN